MIKLQIIIMVSIYFWPSNVPGVSATVFTAANSVTAARKILIRQIDQILHKIQSDPRFNINDDSEYYEWVDPSSGLHPPILEPICYYDRFWTPDIYVKACNDQVRQFLKEQQRVIDNWRSIRETIQSREPYARNIKWGIFAKNDG